MATVTTYTTNQKILNRLSSAGQINVIDDNADGDTADSLSGGDGTTEIQLVTDAKNFAAAEIDSALVMVLNTVPYSQDDANLNAWLEYRATELACWWLCTRKGGSGPSVFKASYERIQGELDDVRMLKKRVPGLTYPSDNTDETKRRRIGRPIVVNP